MATVITGFSDDRSGGSVLRVEDANAELLRRISDQFPDATFQIVSGGRGADAWNLLVRGNGWSEPTSEQEEAASEAAESIFTDATFWTRAFPNDTDLR